MVRRRLSACIPIRTCVSGAFVLFLVSSATYVVPGGAWILHSAVALALSWRVYISTYIYRTSAVRRLAAAPTGLDWPMTVSVPARTFAISSASAFLFLLFIRPDDEGGAGGGDTITTFRHSFPTARRKQSAGELDRNNAKCKQTTASTCLCSLVQRPMAQQT